jgi:hypothetical protein
MADFEGFLLKQGDTFSLELYSKSVKKDGRSLQNVPKDLQTLDMCMDSVGQFG